MVLDLSIIWTEMFITDMIMAIFIIIKMLMEMRI